MRAYVINVMVVLIIFPVILQTVINLIMLSIGGQGPKEEKRQTHSQDCQCLYIYTTKQTISQANSYWLMRQQKLTFNLIYTL